MEIKAINFGDILMSRPAGREAFLKAKAYVFKDIKTGETVVLDFDKVKVLAPSWADEFISGIQKDYGNEVQCINTENPSVKASLKIIMEQQKNGNTSINFQLQTTGTMNSFFIYFPCGRHLYQRETRLVFQELSGNRRLCGR